MGTIFYLNLLYSSTWLLEVALIYCSLLWAVSRWHNMERQREPGSQCTDGRGIRGKLWMEERLSASHLFPCEKMLCSCCLERKDEEHWGRDSLTPQIPMKYMSLRWCCNFQILLLQKSEHRPDNIYLHPASVSLLLNTGVHKAKAQASEVFVEGTCG